MTKTSITSFTGTYDYLSNFTCCRHGIVLDGMTYDTVEHAFQAAKTLDFGKRWEIRAAHTPGMAKLLGRRVKLRPDWEEIKIDVMLDLLRQKFAPGTALAKLLAGTGDAELIEGNDWGDTFWGVCRGKGENVLGLLLMTVRQELRVDMRETRPDAQ